MTLTEILSYAAAYLAFSFVVALGMGKWLRHCGRGDQ